MDLLAHRVLLDHLDPKDHLERLAPPDSLDSLDHKESEVCAVAVVAVPCRRRTPERCFRYLSEILRVGRWSVLRGRHTKMISVVASSSFAFFLPLCLECLFSSPFLRRRVCWGIGVTAAIARRSGFHQHQETSPPSIPSPTSFFFALSSRT